MYVRNNADSLQKTSDEIEGYGDDPQPNTHITILEFTENAPDHYISDVSPGERAVAAGEVSSRHVPSDDADGFVEVATVITTIELNEEITTEGVPEWCKSPVGKLVLAHWIDGINPEDVVSEQN